MNGYCSSCRCHYTIGKQVGGKLGFALAGAAAGGTSRNPGAALIGALVGLAVGHAVDCNVLPSCPTCRAALRVVDQLV